jgi:hypothetical protein
MHAKTILIATFILAAGSSAFALDGYDGDNNQLPGASRLYRQAIPQGARAQIGPTGTVLAPRRVPKPGGRIERRLFEKAQGLPE